MSTHYVNVFLLTWYDKDGQEQWKWCNTSKEAMEEAGEARITDPKANTFETEKVSFIMNKAGVVDFLNNTRRLLGPQ